MHTSNDFRMASAVAPAPVTTATPKNLSILYLGRASGSSRHRALSLNRFGHRVEILDPRRFLPCNRISNYWIHHTGAWGFGKHVRLGVLKTIKSKRFDLVWVDAGDVVSPQLMYDLKSQAEFVVNYNMDDPYGTRDANKWRLYLKSVPLYDLVVVVRDCNVRAARNAGARKIIRVHMSSDEVAHAPRVIEPRDKFKWKSDVAFIG